MLTYNIQYDKTQTRVQNPITKIWSTVNVPAYTPAQYDLLAAMLEEALGEDFISFAVNDFIGWEMTVLTYNGILVDDIENHNFDLIDPIYQQWYMDQLGA